MEIRDSSLSLVFFILYTANRVRKLMVLWQCGHFLFILSKLGLDICFLFHHQHQPHAADGLDFDVGVSLEELAQLGNEDVEAARGEVVVLCVPAAAQDGFAAHGFIFVLGQDVQDVGFSGGQCLAFAGAVVAQGVAFGVQRVGPN